MIMFDLFLLIVHFVSPAYCFCLLINRLWKLQLSTNNVDVGDRRNSVLDPGSSNHINVPLSILRWTDAIDMSKLQHHYIDSSIPLIPSFFHSSICLNSADTTVLADASPIPGGWFSACNSNRVCENPDDKVWDGEVAVASEKGWHCKVSSLRPRRRRKHFSWKCLGYWNRWWIDVGEHT